MQSAQFFQRADVNQDGVVDISDVIAELDFLFAAHAAPACLEAADTNDDGSVDISDAVYTLLYLFGGRARPAAPFLICGPDGTADEVGCASFLRCL